MTGERGKKVRASGLCVRESEMEMLVEAEKSKYLYDGSLFRPLINGMEEGRGN